MGLVANPNTAEKWRWSVTVDDVDLGVWDTKQGGGVGATTTTHKLGGMRGKVALGGEPDVEAITLSRIYDLKLDHDRIGWLMARAGNGRAVAKGLPLDNRNKPYGTPLVYTGILARVSPPDHDAQSGEAAMYSIEITTDDIPVA